MGNKIKRINLIMPTVGRTSEVLEYIDSLECSSRDLQGVHLFIYNQNDSLCKDLKNYNFKNFNGVIAHSKRKGLSINRNIGLQAAEKGVFGFPDDDCLYYPETLTQVLKFFHENNDVDVVIGRIFDRTSNKNIIKDWPAKEKKLTKFNFYQLASSVTIFLREKPSSLFDERLGAGTNYGSCEDPDFLYCLLKQEKNIIYTPTIEVWHPETDYRSISRDKVYSYARGFGAFIKKDFDYIKLYLLLGCILKKVFQFMFYRKRFIKGYFLTFFYGLFSGIKEF